MVDLDDKIYIQQVLDGETSSFTHLVNKYKDMVFSVCFRILRQREDAEDVAQMAFLKAFNNLHAFKGDSKYSTWLYTIAYRTAISRTKLKKIDTVNEDFHIDIATDNSFPQLEELKSQEQRFYVQKAIEDLHEIDGVIITLFYIEECSIQEIIKITELSEANVKVKLHRARKQLKSNLEGLLQQELKSII
ncbi:MAG: sigma-70 family RNA polymerase sigma factor [Crocinitomicaceae bacterium]|nr:sigma-70 family RNA polymerase sigma factor [Crocinitomicaceae bacterium]